MGLLFVAVGVVTLALQTPQPEAIPSGTEEELVLVDGTRVICAVEQVVNGVVVLRQATGDRQQVEVGRTRLLIGPTARALDRGEVYIDDLSVFFPSVQVGLSHRVSIGAGTPLLIPQAEIHPGEVVWITPKVQVFARRRTQGAIGLLHVAGKGNNGGLAYAVATHGTTNAALTVGAGISYPTLGGARAVVLVGAERRVSPRIKLLTENYLSAGNALLTGGLRVVGRKRTLDLAWFKFPGAAVYPLPLIRMTFQVSGR